MKDLETHDDCQTLVEGFYRTVRDDALLGPLFEGGWRAAGRNTWSE